MLSLHNGTPVSLDAIPLEDLPHFRHAIIESVKSGARLVAFFAQPLDHSHAWLLGLLAHPSSGELSAVSTHAENTYAALTPDCPQAHWFERESAEQCGVRPDGHPWLKPIRFTHSPIGETEFFRVEGDEVHEVAVGPVHAGVIEPGHFRFQCHGERVFHLEISLGYQHRGVERALIGGPTKRSIHYAETLAGDTTIGHATAYCEAVESLARCDVPLRAQMLRGIALELERLANHTGDLGALASDVGFLPTASYCGRLRGEFLNLTALLCGSRFGRGMVRVGGVGFDLDDARRQELLKRLDAASADVTSAVELLWNTPSVMARFEEVGVVSRETCGALGLVGVAARACGVERDARFEFPSGVFRFFQVPVSTWHSGDVFARAYVRWMEIQRSTACVRTLAGSLADGPIRDDAGALAPGSLVVSLVEGWRGEICHVVITDARGQFARYKVIDPSFHNWSGLAMALRDQQISDFPLCNKSFNLSYCGHDL
jgi:Ni,Fe-hydrogenase III large subunit